MDKWLLKSTTSRGETSTSNKPISEKKRKYCDSYIEYGFISSGDGESPLCLLCNKMLQNSSMAPAKLRRHLETSHPSSVGKPKHYFESLSLQQNHQSKKMKTFAKIPEKATVASYKIAQLLCKNKKSHLEAESVILPAILIAVEVMLGPEAQKQMLKIPLSNDTIARKIKAMSNDIDDQVKEAFLNNEDPIWALQIDESTDISGKAQLIAFIRFIREGKIVNQFLFCLELSETTRGQDVFCLVDECITSRNLSWQDCVSVCTDGAPSMLGKHKGFAALVLEVNSSVIVIHCMIHREALMAKVLPEDLQEVMDQVVKMVNFIKSNALRSRIFASLCEAMDSGFKTLLFHTEVRWLSKGKVLQRVCFLKVELISFLDIENANLPFDYRSDLWWLRVSFLADLFEKLNLLNKSLQGPNENIVTSTSKLHAFEKKLALWRSKLVSNNFDAFPLTDKDNNKYTITSDVEETLSNLQMSMKNYFPSLEPDEFDWILNPFGNCEANGLSTKGEEELIDLKADLVRKTSFSQMDVAEFWISMKTEYPELSEKAVKILLPFSTSYLCELGFSALTEIKSKKRERLLMVDQEMRVSLSVIEPRIEKLCSENKCNLSH